MIRDSKRDKKLKFFKKKIKDLGKFHKVNRLNHTFVLESALFYCNCNHIVHDNINNLSEAYGGRILTTTFVNDAAKL